MQQGKCHSHQRDDGANDVNYHDGDVKRGVFFFHTLLYITKSTAKITIFLKIRKFFPFFLAVSFFLLTFATAYKMIVYLFSWATVFAYGFIAAGFFYAYRIPVS